ncbi:MAG: 30S ribosomal protein S20 [Candidatus Nealsonbacteria bacterium]
MPIKNAAKKALRQSFRRQKINTHYERTIKSLIKEAKSLVSQKKAKEAKNLLPDIYQILDKAAKVGTIKKNNASRRKSRLAKFIAKAL